MRRLPAAKQKRKNKVSRDQRLLLLAARADDPQSSDPAAGERRSVRGRLLEMSLKHQHLPEQVLRWSATILAIAQVARRDCSCPVLAASQAGETDKRTRTAVQRATTLLHRPEPLYLATPLVILSVTLLATLLATLPVSLLAILPVNLLAILLANLLSEVAQGGARTARLSLLPLLQSLCPLEPQASGFLLI
jgi:hypothetical protein